MSRNVSAVVSFVVVFAAGFFIGGMLLMPYLPPTPDRPVSFVEGAYWVDNWAGVLLGLVLGALSARAVLRKHKAKRAD